jgi:hypothetical protein
MPTEKNNGGSGKQNRRDVAIEQASEDGVDGHDGCEIPSWSLILNCEGPMKPPFYPSGKLVQWLQTLRVKNVMCAKLAFESHHPSESVKLGKKQRNAQEELRDTSDCSCTFTDRHR